jgi:hypothetical protein
MCIKQERTSRPDKVSKFKSPVTEILEHVAREVVRRLRKDRDDNEASKVANSPRGKRSGGNSM